MATFKFARVPDRGERIQSRDGSLTIRPGQPLRFHAEGEEPLLLIRLGHARMPPATPRRGVALVSTYRTS